MPGEGAFDLDDTYIPIIQLRHDSQILHVLERAQESIDVDNNFLCLILKLPAPVKQCDMVASATLLAGAMSPTGHADGDSN